MIQTLRFGFADQVDLTAVSGAHVRFSIATFALIGAILGAELFLLFHILKPLPPPVRTSRLATTALVGTGLAAFELVRLGTHSPGYQLANSFALLHLAPLLLALLLARVVRIGFDRARQHARPTSIHSQHPGAGAP